MEPIPSTLSDRPAFGEQIISAARDSSRVTGLTHGFYRYPARFSPVFARSVIEAFTEPGDWVFDPFAGGGTTLVEAMALGRNALGIDISSLSAFICETKTLILTDPEIASFERWRSRLPKIVNMHAPGTRFDDYADTGYYRNLESREFWRLRKAVEQALASVGRLRLAGSEKLARCTVLRTAQWALDARKKRPSIPEFRDKLHSLAGEMLDGARTFRERCERSSLQQGPSAVVLHRGTAGADTDPTVRALPKPKLILTSPPYPGIHVLYHRWQVDGRKETPAPFWIAGKLDGAGASYYTMGDRKSAGLHAYFEHLEACFSSVAAMANSSTFVVQIVAFSHPAEQLPRYLRTLQACGLVEHRPWNITSNDGRLWRKVPNRRWHTVQHHLAPGSHEVVLVHRASPS